MKPRTPRGSLLPLSIVRPEARADTGPLASPPPQGIAQECKSWQGSAVSQCMVGQILASCSEPWDGDLSKADRESLKEK